MIDWIKAAGIRAIKTWCQAFIALVPTTAVIISDVNWTVCVSGATLAAVISLITSIAGLPELKGGDDID